jgi:hypothetical protein
MKSVTTLMTSHNAEGKATTTCKAIHLGCKSSLHGVRLCTMNSATHPWVLSYMSSPRLQVLLARCSSSDNCHHAFATHHCRSSPFAPAATLLWAQCSVWTMDSAVLGLVRRELLAAGTVLGLDRGVRSRMMLVSAPVGLTPVRM